MKVIVSKSTGFCYGVSRTIEMARDLLEKTEEDNIPCYSLGQIIHNEKALQLLGLDKLQIIKNPKDGNGGLALIRAHGISDKQRKAFEDYGYTLYDATCPTIEKTVKKIKAAQECNRKCIIIGLENHAETQYLRSCVNNYFVEKLSDAVKLCFRLKRNLPVSVFVQTTFPEDKYHKILRILKSHFKDLDEGCGLCTACVRRRQEALEIAEKCDAVLVLGGENSQNTKDLALALKKTKKPVFFFNGADGLDSKLEKQLSKFSSVGICSGTSTPQIVVDKVAQILREL